MWEYVRPSIRRPGVESATCTHAPHPARGVYSYASYTNVPLGPGRAETSNCRFQTTGGSADTQCSLAARHHSSGYSICVDPRHQRLEKKSLRCCQIGEEGSMSWLCTLQSALPLALTPSAQCPHEYSVLLASSTTKDGNGPRYPIPDGYLIY